MAWHWESVAWRHKYGKHGGTQSTGCFLQREQAEREYCWKLLSLYVCVLLLKVLKGFAVSPNSVTVLQLPPPSPPPPLRLVGYIRQNKSTAWTDTTSRESETDDLRGGNLIPSFVWFKPFN